MRNRLGYIGLILLAVVMMGALLAEGRQGIFVDVANEPDAAAPTLRRLFPDITSPEQIIGIEVRTRDLDPIAIVVEDDQTTWRLRDAPFSPVNGEFAARAREGLGLMPTIGQIERGETPSEAFGVLPNPQIVISFQVQLDSLNVITLYIGDKTPSGDAYYVASFPEDVIFDLVPAQWIDDFVGLMLLSIEPDLSSSGVNSSAP